MKRTYYVFGFLELCVDIFRGRRQKLSLHRCRDSDRFPTIVYLKNLFYTPHRNKMATLQQSSVKNKIVFEDL